MDPTGLLEDAFSRVREAVEGSLRELRTEDITYRIDEESNSIAWLIWHLSRIQDDHIADVAGTHQVWTQSDWAVRFGFDAGYLGTGYGHDSDQVAAVVADAELLRAYHDAVYEATLTFLATVREGDLDRIVDRRWDPPVTLGVRLVSVLSDNLEHAGQAQFVRGIVKRR